METPRMKSWRSLIAWFRPAPAEPSESVTKTSLAEGWSLRLRLLLIVILALSPIAIASVLQGFLRAQSDAADIHDRLIQTARAASTDEENMLAAGEQILRALTNMPEVRDASADCNSDLSDALRGLTFFTNISRIDANGKVVCSAVPEARGLSMTNYPIWNAVRGAKDFVVSGQMTSRLTERPILAVFLPIFDGKERFQGALGITIDVRWLDYMVHAKQLPQDAVVALMDDKGAVIAANRPSVANVIFARGHYTRAEEQNLFTADDAKGRTWTFVTAALLSHQTFIGFAMPQTSLFQATYIHLSSDLLLPIFMIALASLAVWLATDRQVIRWIVYLRRVSAAYQRGHYSLRPRMEHAPSELRMLGNAMSDMAEDIEERDQALRDAVAQKSLLIREIHHRVKNNLQIVMSLLSLQAMRLKDPVAQDALKQAQARINALALVHRILHEIEDQTAVDLKALIIGLSEQVCEGLSDDRRDIQLKMDVIPYDVSSDTAVPLALFTVEVLTNIFKHAFPRDRTNGSIRISLSRHDEKYLRLTIVDDGMGYDPSQPTDSVGTRLIRTFAQQLNGKMEVHSNAGAGTVVDLVFLAPPAPKYS
jgi:two-component sensor histidine kinase